MTEPTLCPCQSGRQYHACCGPYHHNAQKPVSCEALMRSRYCAYVLALGDYLVATHAEAFLGPITAAQLSDSAREMEWMGLEIIGSDQEREKGWVEFKAWFRESPDSRILLCLHERSDFIFENGQWLYTQGKMNPSREPGRNDPCPCGSGRKYKKCQHRT